MEWTEPDWCEFRSGTRFHGEIYPKPDDTPGFTLWFRYDGDGGENELKALAEKIEAFLEEDELQELTNRVGLEYAQVMNDAEKLKAWMESE